ncbi:MAG: nickel-responsive transcriptional regulator NikR [Candidatus Bathyarchaeia archaeon]|nr:nickel-responsive transcriptional regulator NikR [Candidatus Bathyarchaeota archaeon]
MEGIIRVSVTLPPSLLEKLDRMVSEAGYPNRSKAVQDALNAYISEHEWTISRRGLKTGLITVLYDHTAKGLEEALTDIQHRHLGTIISAMHVHLSEHHCLEAIAVKGAAEEIVSLLNDLRSLRGVAHAKLLTI